MVDWCSAPESKLLSCIQKILLWAKFLIDTSGISKRNLWQKVTVEFYECAVLIQIQLYGEWGAGHCSCTESTSLGANSSSLKPARFGFKSDCLFPAATHCDPWKDNGRDLIPSNSGVKASDPFYSVEGCIMHSNHGAFLSGTAAWAAVL